MIKQLDMQPPDDSPPQQNGGKPQRKHAVRQRYSIQIIAAFLTGIFLGIFAGLSASPVASSILSVMLGVAGAAVGVLAGVGASPGSDSESKDSGTASDKDLSPQSLRLLRARVDFIPLASITAGILLGACAGIVVRTNDLLGMRPGWIIAHWKAATNLNDKDIALRLFDEAHPTSRATEQSRTADTSEKQHEKDQTKSEPIHSGLIFASPATAGDCDLLKGVSGQRLRIVMAGLHNERLNMVEREMKNTEDLEIAVKLICPER